MGSLVERFILPLQLLLLLPSLCPFHVDIGTINRTGKGPNLVIEAVFLQQERLRSWLQEIKDIGKARVSLFFLWETVHTHSVHKTLKQSRGSYHQQGPVFEASESIVSTFSSTHPCANSCSARLCLSVSPNKYVSQEMSQVKWSITSNQSWKESMEYAFQSSFLLTSLLPFIAPLHIANQLGKGKKMALLSIQLDYRRAAGVSETQQVTLHIEDCPDRRYAIICAQNSWSIRSKEAIERTSGQFV